MKYNKEHKFDSKLLITILFWIFIVVFIVSATIILVYFYNAEKEKSNMADLVSTVENAISSNDDTSELIDDKDADGNLSKYKELYSRNSDLAGWLKIDDTEINYPVMQTPYDNEYYIRRDFEKNYAESGMLFIDARSDLFNPSTNIMIYGHNMNNGTMFNDIIKYKDEKFWEEHKTIKFDTLKEVGEYQILAACYTEIYPEDSDEFKYYTFFNASNQEEFDNYIDNVKSLADYDTGVTARFGDELITLSTCSYQVDDGRFIVVAKKVN